MDKILEKSLEFLKLKETGLTLYEIMKALNEKYQTYARNIYYNVKTCNT